MMTPFSKPTLGVEEEEAAIRTLRSGWLAAGPETEAFEQEFSDYISPLGEHYYCIFTNSCTSALKMAYKITRELGYTGILYPRNTFCATYSAADEIGLPSMCVEDTTMVSAQPPLAIVNVHYGGVKAVKRCFVEDSAHRIEQNDRLVGKIRCYSFYATKNMTTGAGGMFVTNDKETYERARLFWRDGISNSTYDRAHGGVQYTVQAMAGGYDSTDLAAAIGREQLKKLPGFTARRNEIVGQYNKAFGLDWHGNHLYPIRTGSETKALDLIQKLRGDGIAAGYHYPGTGWDGVSLPLYPLLTDEEVGVIIESVKRHHRE